MKGNLDFRKTLSRQFGKKQNLPVFLQRGLSSRYNLNEFNAKALEENNYVQEKFEKRIKRPRSRFDGVKQEFRNTVRIGDEERSLSDDDSLDLFLFENKE